MKIYDIIEKKKYNKEPLSKDEISFFVNEYTNGEIKDYQAAALLMAICINGMNEHETTYLTNAMTNSGDIIDLSAIKGVIVDKHSTGGVGDSTTIALAPILACCGVKVAKMSGRGLGFGGGTIDKLESIPNFNTSISKEKFENAVNTIGCSVIGQTTSVAPADKLIYALRDVTATVDSVPLIASSVMSKKLGCGANIIVLDVKYGSGAFMKTKEEALALAELMVKIGTMSNKKMGAIITSMEQPLGEKCGNSLEVIGVIDVLKGRDNRLAREIKEVAKKMLVLSELYKNEADALARINEVIATGEAFKKLIELVEAHGGDSEYIKNPSKFVIGKPYDILAEKSGFLSKFNTENFGKAIVSLGGGRVAKTDIIDNAVGIEMRKELGDYVNAGDVIVTIYHSDKNLNDAISLCQNAISYSDKKTPPHKIALAFVDKNGTRFY